MRVRAVLFLLVAAVLAYRLSPPERRLRWRGRLRELGRAVLISIVIYWVWILAARAWRGW